MSREKPISSGWRTAMFSRKLFWKSTVLSMVMGVLGAIFLDGAGAGVHYAVWMAGVLLLPFWLLLRWVPTNALTVCLALVLQVVYGYLITVAASALLQKIRRLRGYARLE